MPWRWWRSPTHGRRFPSNFRLRSKWTRTLDTASLTVILDADTLTKTRTYAGSSSCRDRVSGRATSARENAEDGSHASTKSGSMGRHERELARTSWRADRAGLTGQRLNVPGVALRRRFSTPLRDGGSPNAAPPARSGSIREAGDLAPRLD